MKLTNNGALLTDSSGVDPEDVSFQGGIAVRSSTGAVYVSDTSLKGPINVSFFGAKSDGKAVYDATSTAVANSVITSATANFTQDDVGKVCTILPYTDTQMTPRWGTITAVNSATSVTTSLSASPGALSNAIFVYGTDDTVAVQDALLAAKAFQGSVLIPVGITCCTDTITIPTGCTLEGVANFHTGGKSKDFTFSGSSLVLCRFRAGQFVAGGDTLIPNSPKGIVMRNLNIDCLNNSENTFRNVAGRTLQAVACTFVRGTQETFNSSPTSRCELCVFMGSNQFNVVQLVGDSTFLNNIVTGAGATYYSVKTSNGDDINISNNHLWKDSTTSFAGGQIFISQNTGNVVAGGISITNNKFDTSYGPHILIRATGSSTLRGVLISGNIAMQNDNVPAATYPYIKTEIEVGSTLRCLSVVGNLGRSSFDTPANGVYTYFLDNDGSAGTILGSTVVGNAIDNCNALYRNITPDYTAGNITIAGTGTVVALG